MHMLLLAVMCVALQFMAPAVLAQDTCARCVAIEGQIKSAKAELATAQAAEKALIAKRGKLRKDLSPLLNAAQTTDVALQTASRAANSTLARKEDWADYWKAKAADDAAQKAVATKQAEVRDAGTALYNNTRQQISVRARIARLSAALEACQKLCRAETAKAAALKAAEDAKAQKAKDAETAKGAGVKLATTNCAKCVAVANALNELLIAQGVDLHRLALAQAERKTHADARDKAKARWDGLEAQAAKLVERHFKLVGKAGNDDELGTIQSRLKSLNAPSALARADQTRAQALLDAVDARITALTAAIAKRKPLIAMKRAALSACEKTCAPASGAQADGSPAGEKPSTNDTTPPYKVAATACPQCEAIASELNDVRGMLVAAEAALVAANTASDAARRAVQTAEADAQRLKSMHATRANWRADRKKTFPGLPEPSLSQQETFDGLAKRTRESWQWLETRRIPELEAASEAARKAALEADQQVAALNRREAALVAALKSCEQLCQKRQALKDKGIDPDLPYTPVRTKCPACLPAAKAVNDALALEAKLKAEVARDTEAEARLEGEVADLKEAVDSAQWTIDEGKRQMAGPKELRPVVFDHAALVEDRDARHKLLNAKVLELNQHRSAARKVAARLAETTKSLPGLRKKLADCEKTCVPGKDREIGLGGDGFSPDGAFVGVTTDCPPCATVVSFLNDALGTRLTLKRELSAAQAALAAAQGKAAKAKARLADANADAEAQRRAMHDASARNDTGSFRLYAERMGDNLAKASFAEHDLDVAEEAAGKARKDLDRLSTELASVNARITLLQARLSACEKQCKPGQTTGTSEDAGDTSGADCDDCASTTVALGTVRSEIAVVTEKIRVLQEQLVLLRGQETTLLVTAKDCARIACGTALGATDSSGSLAVAPVACNQGAACDVAMPAGLAAINPGQGGPVLVVFDAGNVTSEDPRLACARSSGASTVCILSDPSGATETGTSAGSDDAPDEAILLSARFQAAGDAQALCASRIDPAALADGDRASDLNKAIQLGLNHHGHDVGAADGVFGPKTRRAIAAYADGKPGLETSDAILVAMSLFGGQSSAGPAAPVCRSVDVKPAARNRAAPADQGRTITLFGQKIKVGTPPPNINRGGEN